MRKAIRKNLSTLASFHHLIIRMHNVHTHLFIEQHKICFLCLHRVLFNEIKLLDTLPFYRIRREIKKKKRKI